MSEKTKNIIFFSIIGVLIAGSVAASFIKYYIQKDYQVVAEVSCDPQTEKCFVYECDPADDSTCPVNPAERISYYKMISKTAANILICEQTEEKIGCANELSCTENESSCSYTFCDPANLSEGEQCSE